MGIGDRVPRAGKNRRVSTHRLPAEDSEQTRLQPSPRSLLAEGSELLIVVAAGGVHLAKATSLEVKRQTSTEWWQSMTNSIVEKIEVKAEQAAT